MLGRLAAAVDFECNLSRHDTRTLSQNSNKDKANTCFVSLPPSPKKMPRAIVVEDAVAWNKYPRCWATSNYNHDVQGSPPTLIRTPSKSRPSVPPLPDAQNASQMWTPRGPCAKCPFKSIHVITTQEPTIAFGELSKEECMPEEPCCNMAI